MTAYNTDHPYKIRTIFQKGFEQFSSEHSLTPNKIRTGQMIAKCKTGELGYNRSICPDCGHLEIHNSSCNRKDCPNCQSLEAARWACERNTEKIEGIAYYHYVLTIPFGLNPLIYQNQKSLYNLLFKSASQTIIKLCKDPDHMGAQPGIIAALHTHGQQLNYHPHIHLIISGGGLTKTNQFIETKHKGYLLPKKTVAKMFRGMFMDGLKKLYFQNKLTLQGHCVKYLDPANWQTFIDKIYSTDWIVHVNETFNGKGNAIDYLSRYTYRSAISNSRIKNVTDTHVTFEYKDYADSSKKKLKTVTIQEFIGLFMQHVLPERFNRIRFYGYLTNSKKIQNLKLINKLRNCIYVGNPYKELSKTVFIQLIYQRDITRCPKCKQTMVVWPPGMPIETLLGIREF